jgi:hypothetical protein
MRKQIWKYAVLVLISIAAWNVHAMGNGFYLGTMFGPATNKAPPLPLQTPTPVSGICPNGTNPPCTVEGNPRHNQYAVRIFMGNQFSPYAAIEGGVTFISSTNYKAGNTITSGGTDQRIRDLDVVFKGILSPETWPVSVYGKAGIAVTYLTVGGALNPTFKPATPQRKAIVSGANTYKNKISPTFSLGASYDINQSWQTDVSFNAVLVGDKVNRVSFIALGLTYHFTDKYCGQFLCDD